MHSILMAYAMPGGGSLWTDEPLAHSCFVSQEARVADSKKSGNPAKAAKAVEESRAAANRVSRTPVKVKDVHSPRWYAPTMVGLMLIGLVWVVVTYLFQGAYPVPYFVKSHGGDWLRNGNLYLGALIALAGFLGLLRWK